MAWSVDDLSTITQLLIDKLNAAVLASPQYINQHFAYEVNGLMPAVSRTDGTSVLSLYLLPVSYTHLSTPSEAFQVKCDSTTTSPADQQNGVVNIVIGVALLKPAEFVVITISQLAGQTS